jgi:hypothetical protein
LPCWQIRFFVACERLIQMRDSARKAGRYCAAMSTDRAALTGQRIVRSRQALFLPGGLAKAGETCGNRRVRRQRTGKHQKHKAHRKGKAHKRHQGVALLP